MTSTIYKVIVTFFFVLSNYFAFSQLIHVPSDFPTIQQAIDAANVNDTVLVQNGNYAENLLISQGLTIASPFILSGDTMDALNTVIDGDTSGTVVTISGVSGSSVELVGLTITNGSGTLYSAPGFPVFPILYGGGMFIVDVDQVLLNNMIIEENNLPGINTAAGGIYCESSHLILQETRVRRNSIASLSLEMSNGNGIYSVYSQLEVYNSIISENRDMESNYGSGGGIFCMGGKLHVEDSDIHNNFTGTGGAAVHVTATDSVYIYNTSFKGDQSSLGGIISMDTVGYCRIDHSDFIDHDPATDTLIWGTDGLRFGDCGTLHLSNNYFAANNVDRTIRVLTADSLIIENCLIEKSETKAIFAATVAEVIINHLTIDSCYHTVTPSSVSFGHDCGGITMTDCSADIDGLRISNVNGLKGGGLFARVSDVTLRRAVIHNTEALYGGALYVDASKLTLISSTITGNSADFGSAFATEGNNQIIVVNSILWNEGGAEIMTRDNAAQDTTELRFAYSDIRGGSASILQGNDLFQTTMSAGIFDVYPEYVDTTNFDLHLAGSSPLIDEGTSFYVFNSDTLVNYAPLDYMGSAPDIGAFEFSGASAIQELGGVSQLLVFPNPNSGAFFLSSSEPLSDVTVQLFDVQGKLVHADRFAHLSVAQTIATDLSEGLYTLRVLSSSGIGSSRVVVR